MAGQASSGGALIEKLMEFERLASALDLPLSERLGILNVPEDLYDVLRDGRWPEAGDVTPELERRLTYALPLMRRLASAPGRGGAAKTPDAGHQVA